MLSYIWLLCRLTSFFSLLLLLITKVLPELLHGKGCTVYSLRFDFFFFAAAINSTQDMALLQSPVIMFRVDFSFTFTQQFTYMYIYIDWTNWREISATFTLLDNHFVSLINFCVVARRFYFVRHLDLTNSLIKSPWVIELFA